MRSASDSPTGVPELTQAVREGEKTIEHPSLGPIAVNCDVLGDDEARRSARRDEAEGEFDDEYDA